MIVRRLLSALACTALLAGPLTSTAVSAGPAGPAGARPTERASGQWRVDQVAAGVYRLTWRAPQRLPLTSDRPVVRADGRVLGPATLARDGRTLTLDVRTNTPPDPSRLDVVLSGDRLDVRGRDLRPAQAGEVTRLETTPLPDDPATPGPFGFVVSDYELPPVKLSRMREPIEMVGHVVEPAADAETGPRPLVLFLHGRHGFCYEPGTDNEDWEWPCRPPFVDIPSHLGYDYIQRVLASQGYATVSVRVNGINAQDWRLADGGAAARAAIVQRHLDHWVGVAADHQVDLSRVVLVGHSRGGEGVNRASIQIPLSAPYRIVGQTLLAPTNFGTQTTPYVPTVTVLPYCDGDVIDLQGQRFTDSARDLTRDDTSLKSSVLVMGANHNFFNTEWTPGVAVAPAFDDWWGNARQECGRRTPSRLTAAEQRAVGVAYVAGAVRLFADDAQQFLPLFDGSPVSVPSTGDADVRSAAIGGGSEIRRPRLDAGRTLPAGAVSRFCDGAVEFEGPVSICGRERELSTIQTPHWPDSGEFTATRPELEVSWSAAGQTAGLVLDDPLDLTDRRLSVRTIVDPERGDAGLRLRLTDADGETALVDPVGGTTLPALPLGEGLGKRWAQALTADPSSASGVDLTRIAAVDLVSVTESGRVWVLDVAAMPDALATVPDKRAPLISLRTVEVPEGDEPGPVEVEVPFSITGDITGRESFTVGVVSYDPERPPFELPIELAPGQTTGSVSLTYKANRLDDFPRRGLSMVAVPNRGLMTDVYHGSAVIVDDDPTPRMTLRPVDRSLTEGSPATWRVELSKPLGYDVFFAGTISRGPRSPQQLQVADVPRGWLERRVGKFPPAATRLWTLDLFIGDELRAGRKRLDFSVPTVADAVAEGPETITLRMRLLKEWQARTINVTD